MSKGGHKSKRGRRTPTMPFIPFDGLSIGAEPFSTGRAVWTAQYGHNAGYSDSDPIKAVAEAMEHAARVCVPTMESDDETQRAEG